MIVLGLTGSIGMGKSTTADLFRTEGVPVHDSDATVHALYAGEAVAPVEALFPGVVRDSRIDRHLLAAHVMKQPASLRQLEDLIHPMVAADRDAFLRQQKAQGAPVVVLDIPLLFEIGGDRFVDAIVVVTASEAVQKARVLARPGMTVEKFDSILARQMPDCEKRRRAQFIIDTDSGLDHARRQVRSILSSLSSVQGGNEKSPDA